MIKSMTLQEAFLAKYPTGHVHREGRKFVVVFKAGQRVYEYQAPNSLELLVRLECAPENAVYKHEMKIWKEAHEVAAAEAARVGAKLAQGIKTEIDDFFGLETDLQGIYERKTAEAAKYAKLIETSIVVD